MDAIELTEDESKMYARFQLVLIEKEHGEHTKNRDKLMAQKDKGKETEALISAEGSVLSNLEVVHKEVSAVLASLDLKSKKPKTDPSSESPTVPATPATPATPSTPTSPTSPATPATPATPGKSEPTTSTTPTTPTTPTKPDKPAK